MKNSILIALIAAILYCALTSDTHVEGTNETLALVMR